ncbi:MAG: tetratricopeptide repeat protein [Bacteroidales bacterium]|nr:tetratricopeptide repeat protein [Bacteroidales bacterium]
MGKFLKSNRISIVLATGLVVASCSVEKNTNLSRFYHNLTSNYNIYYNANEAYLNGVKRIEDAYEDDYTMLIPVFEYSDENAARAGTGDMDRAILKASKLISLHSMTAKPEMDDNKPLSEKEQEFFDRKDYNNWVDDSYLLMGKAQLLKNEPDEARITLLHNIRETHDEKMRAVSTIWLARTYNEMGNYPEANRLLTEMNPQVLDKTDRADYYLTLGDMYIRQNQYERAFEPLTAALDNLSGQKDKNRPAFILARLYEESGNSEQATKYYSEVIKLNPTYEMEFNARISQAGVFNVESGDVDDIRKQLRKLLRDAKNREYRDQIYFALGNLSMREGKEDEAIEYYKQSAASSSTNNNQKGRSYLMLADYYFDKPDYRQSQMYYDSAVTFLDQNYPGYAEYYNRSLNLNELISYLDIINTQDSLQYIASLSPSEIDNIISGIIRKIEEEERQASASVDDRYNMGRFYENQRRFRDNIEASGQWYFYNQSALTFGRTEFRNRWGDRKLEDNWRRRNKSTTGAVNNRTEVTGEQKGENNNTAADTKSKEYYLKNLPMTDSLIEVSDKMIADALYNSARLYQEKFNDIEKANQSYTDYMSRFPVHYRVPQALYNMYRLNEDSDLSLANSYKSKLIDRFPESEYSKILSDPDYLESRIKEENRAEQVYNEAYREWLNGNTRAVIHICDSAEVEFPESELLPKFMLLKSFALAPSVSEKTLKEELLRITTGFPGSEEAGRASKMIAYLNTKVPELKKEEEIQIAKQLYDTLDTPPYRFIIILKDTGLDMNRLAFDVINYNIDNYTNENYNTRGELVDNKYITITVGIFQDIANAMEYYYNFNPPEILRNIGESEILSFIISSSNFESFSADKDADKYYLFFRENYLK